MNRPGRIFIFLALVLPLQAQGVALHLDVGLTASLDHNWKNQRDTTGATGLVTKFPLALEGALLFPAGPGGFRVAIRHAVDEPFSDLQYGVDWVQTFSRKGVESFYGSAGLSLNNVKGRIQVVPPNYPAPGVYEERSQSGRPGARLALGYAFSRRFAFECAVNSINLESTGANGFLHSSSMYVTLTGSLRIPKVFGTK